MERGLRDIFRELLKVRRWEHLSSSYKESVAEHTLKMSFLCMVMLAIERRAGVHQINEAEILGCVITHDWGEILVNDISRHQKTPEREKAEDEAFATMMSSIVPPDLLNYFQLPIDRRIDVDDLTREFWNACEHIGYLIFAFEEYYGNGEQDFLQVIRDEQKVLMAFRKKFVSVDSFLVGLEQTMGF
ncbi:MAG: YfbR-like 5'-deoxynucleotidase [Candidatus Magasanikbacteria bacterium]